MKNQRGITLVALILTIIISLIIVSVSVSTGIDTYKNSKTKEFVYEMQLIQKKIDLIAEQKEEFAGIGSDYDENSQFHILLEEAQHSGEITFNINDIPDKTNIRYLNNSYIKNNLELDNISYEVLVNFDTREVVSLKGIEYNGKTYYTQYKLPGGQAIIGYTENDKTISYDIEKQLNGLSATMIIKNVSIKNRVLKYQKKDSNYWNTITNKTKPDTYRVEIREAGTYTFIIVNQTGEQVSQEMEIELNNVPKLETGQSWATWNSNTTEYTITEQLSYDYSLNSENWIFMTQENKYYVWIPRFAYNNDTNNIVFLKTTTNLTTSGISIQVGDAENAYTIPEEFMKPAQANGIWVQVSENETPNFDCKGLLEETNREHIIK